MTAFFIQLAIAIVLAVLAYVFAPKPKPPKPEAAKDAEIPTAEAGRPIPVIFGEGTVKSPNTLWYGDVSSVVVKVKM